MKTQEEWEFHLQLGPRNISHLYKILTDSHSDKFEGLHFNKTKQNITKTPNPLKKKIEKKIILCNKTKEC